MLNQQQAQLSQSNATSSNPPALTYRVDRVTILKGVWSFENSYPFSVSDDYSLDTQSDDEDDPVGEAANSMVFGLHSCCSY